MEKNVKKKRQKEAERTNDQSAQPSILGGKEKAFDKVGFLGPRKTKEDRKH